VGPKPGNSGYNLNNAPWTATVFICSPELERYMMSGLTFLTDS
jgi:hypothetical protein